jgi:two-component system phosphate regulon sensor histidine kinase PhoR
VEVSFGLAGDKVFVKVVDHGEGISPEDLERITEPFYRADPARSRHTGGFGLGLYLCRRIVEAHGGELVMSSKPGIGTSAMATLSPRV